MGLVFAVVFIVVLLVIACIALGFFVRERALKFTLWGAACVLAVFFSALFFFSLPKDEEEDDGEMPPIEAEVKTEEEKPKQEGNVGVVIDAGTLRDSGGYDPIKAEPLLLESMESAPAEDKKARDERKALSKTLNRIDSEMMSSVNNLGAQAQAVDARFKAMEINNYEAIFAKSKCKIRQYEIIISGMDAKMAALDKSKYIKSSDIDIDRESVKKRRDEAVKKRDEYQGVLDELTANAEILMGVSLC